MAALTVHSYSTWCCDLDLNQPEDGRDRGELSIKFPQQLYEQIRKVGSLWRSRSQWCIGNAVRAQLNRRERRRGHQSLVATLGKREQAVKVGEKSTVQ